VTTPTTAASVDAALDGKLPALAAWERLAHTSPYGSVHSTNPATLWLRNWNEITFTMCRLFGDVRGEVCSSIRHETCGG